MKKRFIWILAAALLLCLTACGKTEGTESTPATGETNADPIQSVPFSTGEFTVQVPEGWFVAEVYNILEEPISSRLRLAKGEGDEMEYGSFPHLEITFFSPEFYLEHEDPEAYEDVEMIDACTFGDKTFSGFSGKSNGQKMVHLWCNAETTQFTVTVWINGELDSVSIQDADVQAIIASLKPQ